MMNDLLNDCRKLFLRNYRIDANIGVHEFEKQGPQILLINAELYVPLALTTPKDDHLSEVLDYDFMRSTIHRRVSQGHIHLQETLCDDIARLLLDNSIAVAVRVSTEKPDVYTDCDSVGVEVFLRKS
jgi:dihydroneopterin aldolase